MLLSNLYVQHLYLCEKAAACLVALFRSLFDKHGKIISTTTCCHGHTPSSPVCQNLMYCTKNACLAVNVMKHVCKKQPLYGHSYYGNDQLNRADWLLDIN